MPKAKKVKPVETTQPADGWICPACGLQVDSCFGKCGCGTAAPTETAMEVLAPEVLPPENTQDGQMSPVRHLDEAAQAINPENTPDGQMSKNWTFEQAAAAINAEYIRWKHHDRETNLCMLRMGIVMELVIAELPHGQWEKWREANISVSRSHTYNFRAVAQKFMIQKKLGIDKAKALLVADDTVTDDGESFQQLAFDFIGDKSQSELFEMCGKLRAAPRGGDHGGGAASHRDAQIRHRLELDQSLDEWNHLIQTFRNFALRTHHYTLVPPPVLNEGLKSIRDCIVKIERIIAKG
jgi:hypothetical protein